MVRLLALLFACLIGAAVHANDLVGNKLIVTPGNGTNLGVVVVQSGSGALTAPSTCDPSLGNGFSFNCFKVSSDTIGAWGMTSELTLNYTFGGNDDADTCTPYPIHCSHTNLWLNLTQDKPTVGVAFNAGLLVNHTVTPAAPGYLYNGTTPVQGVFGIGVQVSDDGGRHYGVTGGEIDVALTKPDTLRKMGWEVVSAPLAAGNDLYQGTLFSAAYDAFSGACGTGSGAGGGGCAGFKYGFSFGRDDAYVPVTEDGTLIVVTPGIGTATFAHGIDLSAATFTADAFRSPGFTVNGRGEVKTSASFPAIFLNDTNTTPTTGGLTRIIAGTGGLFFQLNKAAEGDFSTAITALAYDSNGSVMFGAVPDAPVFPGPGGMALCIDNAGFIYKKPACP